MTTRYGRTAARRRILFGALAAAATAIAALAALTYAWFTGRAASTENRLAAGSMDLELLTTSPTRTVSQEEALTELSPAGLWSFADYGLEDVSLRAFFSKEDGSFGEIVSMGDTPQSLVKFLEYSDPSQNASSGTVVRGALPGFRQQRPILVYNPNDGEAAYTLDFVARAADGAPDLRSAFYLNCTPLGMCVERPAGQKPQYSLDPSLLGMDVPASIFEGVAGVGRPAHHREETGPISGYEKLAPLLARPDAANGASIRPVDASRVRDWADAAAVEKRTALTAVLAADGRRTIRIQPHSYHVYLVDMGIYPTAGNSYQGAEMTLDIVLTAQQKGDTVHRVYDETELARAITDNAVKAKANGTAGGDTIVLMQDITVTSALPAYRAVFNLVLDGHTLTFGQKRDAAGEVTDFGSLLVAFPEVAATMEVGSPTGGRIVNADRMHFEPGTAPCVLTWYSGLCFRETADDSGAVVALPPGPADAAVDSPSDSARHPRLSATNMRIFQPGAQDTVNADAAAVPASIVHVVDSPRIQLDLRTN